MKNKFLIILLILFVVPLNVLADKNVTVKYRETYNNIIYKTANNGNDAECLINDNVVKITNQDSSLNIIKTQGDANKWISSINGNNDYYYVEVADNENSKLIIDNSLITVYDLDGRKVTSENNQVNISINKFYFTIDDIKNEFIEKANLEITGHGKVIIDGVIYTENSLIDVKSDESTIIIMSDATYSGYEVTVDGVSIQDLFNGNRLKYNLKNINNLSVNFKDTAVKYDNSSVSLDGYIYKDNLPVQNAKVVLNDLNEQVTYTDNLGYYEFNNVNYGEHELLVVAANNVVLGYINFNVLLKDGKIIVGNNSISVKNDKLSLNLFIDDDYHIDIENAVKKSNYILIFGILIIILLLIILCIYKKYRNKR